MRRAVRIAAIVLPTAAALGGRAPAAGQARPRDPAAQIAVGCTHHGPKLDYHGSQRGRDVALTFDDGPSPYTARVLHILDSLHARGTFFEVGDNTAGHHKTMRNIIRDGDEIGNHSTHHTAYPSYSDLRHTSSLIKHATGFRPCLFRPPYGAVNDELVRTAARAGMKTIGWDVDPRDWARPGTGAIYSNVVDTTRPGSIVIMHDGGGDRSETVAALPSIIRTLRRHGYRFDTVSQLLGDRFLYQRSG